MVKPTSTTIGSMDLVCPKSKQTTIRGATVLAWPQEYVGKEVAPQSRRLSFQLL